MNTSILRIFLVSAAAFIAGCASTNTSVSADAAKQFKTIGVISVAANTFTRQYVGTTVFGNEREQKDVVAWAINTQYEMQLAAAVETAFNAKAVRAPYSAADFSRVHDTNGPWDAPAFSGPNWGAIEGATRSYCAATGVDAVVVAGRVKTGDLFGQTNQVVEGLGIYSRRNIYVLHLLAVVGLMDCKTGKPIAARNLTPALGGNRPFFATRTLPEELARKKIPEWTPEIEQQMKQMAIALPDQAWVETLTRMVPANK